ncbi:hypothetical protein TNCV_2180161 [Trichonephila clavipes]|uniref:Uncharacterized protein n=1 Tax=Trichonephila clavipes TaxID=2585209 RepID=A0A8X7B7W0_TRICX|nr:hypothetical protein TNCV_2180161 [Trichonephila clavipes]
MLDWREIRRSGWSRMYLSSCKTVHSNTCRMWSGIISQTAGSPAIVNLRKAARQWEGQLQETSERLLGRGKASEKQLVKGCWAAGMSVTRNRRAQL